MRQSVVLQHPSPRLLLDHSADPNQARADNGFTALMAAAQDNHLEVTRLLLDNSADANQARTDDTACTALTYAAHSKNLDITQLLMDRS